MGLFCAALVVLNHSPSPNDQFHAMGEPAEVSVKDTIRGAVPDVGVPLNAAVGTSQEVTVI
ncbi:hypothetical protein ASZ90_011359 [hydrocarbon metagenome]|uniref:Uncharacterized protein n=1 Tax=hydrocarbon metagenome TaxID=938273 RepID=A0A0W8FDI4_9ZZZZ